jgi:CheY-like chemotaxis protein
MTLQIKLQNSMELTTLIVDDDTFALTDYGRYITQIKPDRKDKTGIAEFKIDKASTVESALELLTQHISSPYDIVLLDMELPPSEDDQYEMGGYVDQDSRDYRGFEILHFIKKTGAAQAVIVVSGHPDTMLGIFRKGAFDFIAKSIHREDLQGRVLICWSRLLSIRSKQIFDARIGDLVPYAEKGLAHRFTACFSNLVQTVAHSSEDIEKYMHERYGLDRRKDSQDFLFKCLKGEEASVAKIQKEWTALQAAVLPQEESSRAETVDALLKDIHQSLRPCLIVKNVELELMVESTTEILSFDDDVRAILKEIIVGALNTRPDHNDIKQTIRIEIGDADGQVRVSFVDQLKPMTTADAKRINDGSNISPARRFEREWGLSVVQHIAMRGGGRLAVKPLARGNIVTYFVPMAR